MEDLHKSKMVQKIIVIIGIVIVVLSILKVGIGIGESRARFAGQFGDNFERNFIGPRDGMMGKAGFGRMMPGVHGAAGEIISINLPQLVISGPDNLEKTVLLSTSTTIRHFQQNVASTDLKVGDFVVIIGNPDNSGRVEAKLIRIMPSPETQIR